MDLPQAWFAPRRPARAAGVLAIALLAWAALAWLALDMAHPLAQLTMPGSSRWTPANVLAVFAMWAVMMAAMMLPSAWPMVRTVARMGAAPGAARPGPPFAAAYLAVWLLFSAAATLLQWAWQSLGWLDPMLVGTSPWLLAALLGLAGVYQFSPLKRQCLARCRAPLFFLIGRWRPGTGGAFAMGLRHGLTCVGCCWALMALLFVGGAMNLAWVAALSVAVAIEKLAPGGERLSLGLGLLLIGAGAFELVGALGAG
jgi:predicted metal-binding membrane protein